MSTDGGFVAIPGMDRAAQVAWMQSLRSKASTIELVFHDGDVDHPLTKQLAWLSPTRQEGVGARPGYPRPQPTAVLHRYPYDRGILRALNEVGGLFDYVSAPTGDTVRLPNWGMSMSPSSTIATRFSDRR
ncbi:hypothetical protein JNO54_05975 [Janibacter sp. YIM B02568]|uniref:hypothetical protein n=1 Tax=Janibacter endophyticus TaxID=2806261 RepID=UPI001951BEF8|nr:hypothetical protein [Janibacter endophyticus]MBM6545686.1 hypothetical protein [Janibacter endophyticus]